MDVNQQLATKQVEVMKAKSQAFDRIMELEAQNKQLTQQAQQLGKMLNGLSDKLGVSPDKLVETIEGLVEKPTKKAK